MNEILSDRTLLVKGKSTIRIRIDTFRFEF